MALHTKPGLRVLLFISALLPASASTRAQLPPAAEELGLSGYVLAPDGTPVTGGSVMIQSLGVRATASIERTGRFRLVPNRPGPHQVFVSVSGLAPYRVSVTVPPSRTLKLPVIRLSPATYFRARFVSAAGEPIISPRLRRRSLDVNGNGISEPRDASVSDPIDGDGTITIGPLPRGVTTFALDMPFLAQTRLPDLYVTGAEPLFDAGTVIVQPGAVLHVDLVDATGAPVPRHDVYLEDVLPLSPLSFRPVRTDRQGRATFERLGAGNYRVRTSATERCGGTQLLSIARVVSVSGRGTLRLPLIVSGNATFRITSPLGPLRGITVSASPDLSLSPPPAWLRSRSDSPPLGALAGPFVRQTSCGGGTDEDGRVTLTNFPPGPARVAVRLVNSTYVRRVTVPDAAREVAIDIPDGYLPLRVTHGPRNEPVAAAAITWTGGGARVEATASGSGEALLEGVGTAGGTLAITARGYQPAEAQLAEPPAMLHEVALLPVPVTPSFQPRVVTTSGEPLPNAVVEIFPANPIEVGHIAVTDAKGSVSFPDAPPGSLRLVASADGFIPAVMAISDDSRSGIVLTLSRGYRAIASVELPVETGPHLVRVVNEAGVSMEHLLDIASDRRIESPGRLSLGPLAPGTYVVELHGPREHWRQLVSIVDRDVYATLR